MSTKIDSKVQSKKVRSLSPEIIHLLTIMSHSTSVLFHLHTTYDRKSQNTYSEYKAIACKQASQSTKPLLASSFFERYPVMGTNRSKGNVT